MKLLTKTTAILSMACAVFAACDKNGDGKKLDKIFRVDPTEISFSAFGDSKTVILGMGKDVKSWDIAPDADAWYSVTKNADGISFVVTAPENSSDKRTADLVCVGSVSDGSEVTAKVSLSQESLADDPLVTGATSLNIDGVTANCYIVSKAGTYRFVGNKKGNGENLSIIMNAGIVEMEGAPISPSGAKLVWQDRKGLVQSVFYTGGQIFFTTGTTFTKGNALIAAIDDAGTILWSWHIWFTDQPEELIHKGQDNKNFVFLDRNLGATTVATKGGADEPEAYGLLYQHGRKEPLRGGANWDETTATVLPFYDIEGNDVSFSMSPENKTGVSEIAKGIQIGIENPLTIYARGDDTFHNWTGTYEEGVCLSEFKYLWGRWTGGQADYNSNNGKTIYDPCPAGYMIASVGSFINPATIGDDLKIAASPWSAPSGTTEFRTDGVSRIWTGQPMTSGGNTRHQGRTLGCVNGTWNIYTVGWENCLSVRCLKEIEY